MKTGNDAELLQEFASANSEAAFQALVERHLPLVYSAALRQVAEPVLAENLTHVVFILLARKADQLSPETILPEWLFRTTRQLIAKGRRGEQRPRRRELRKFGRQMPQLKDPWAQVAPFLDAALAQLPEAERGLLLLHYFQFRRIAEVGVTLGISEETAQWKIARAIRRLRRLLLARGTDVPMEVLPGLLMTRGAPAAPSYLGASVTAAALRQVPVSTPVYALLQGAGREPSWPKVSTALWKIAAVAVLTGLIAHFWPHRTLEDTVAYSFESKIVMRPPYVASAPSTPVVPPTMALTASTVATPTHTNAPPPTSPIAFQLSAANVPWSPGGNLTALAQRQTESGEPPAAAPTPDSGSSAPQLSLSTYPPGYLPARNVFQGGAEFHPIYSNNFIPWTTPGNTLIVVPTRFRAAAPPRKR